MRRPTNRLVIAAISAATYAALWWGAIIIAALVAFRNLPTDGETADRIAEGIGAVLNFAVAVLVGLMLAHAAWAVIVGWLMPPGAHGLRFALLLAIVVVANITAPITMRVFGSQEKLGWIALTVALPGIATWWAAGAKATAT